MQTLSFITIFKRYGKLFRQYLQHNIEVGRDIEGKAFIPSQGSVIGGKRSKKVSKIKGTGQHTRLYVTGKLAKNGFTSQATDTTLTISGNDAIHSKGVSFANILFYNNKPTSTNDKSPLIFPVDEEQLNMTAPMKQLQSEMTTELVSYFNDTCGVDVTKILKIG